MAKWFDRYPGPDQMVFGAPAALHALETKLGIPAGQAMRGTAYRLRLRRLLCRSWPGARSVRR